MFALRRGHNFPMVLRCPTYFWTGAEHILAIAILNISNIEQHAFDTGDAEFALHVDGPVISLLYRFGVDLPWSDSQLNVWNGGRLDRESANAIQLTRLESNHRIVLSLVLVESRTNKITGLRALTLSPLFTQAFVQALQQQINAGPVSDDAFFRHSLDLYRRFPTTAELLRVAIARTIGGA